MGTAFGFKCRNCEFEANLGATQPYFLMSGSVTDKYCPKTGEIVRVFTGYYDNKTEIKCQDKEWQKEFGNPAACRNCKGECLQDLEMLAVSDDSEIWGEKFGGYKCPRCGSDLGKDCIVSFINAD